jgi:hypothetical protein
VHLRSGHIHIRDIVDDHIRMDVTYRLEYRS